MRRSTLQLVIASFALVLPPGAASLSARPPITLIGGFLGAGKTAAVTSLLSSRAGLKIAVLVNDLASVNVDAGTVRRASAQEDGVETIELQNGCVCCGAGASAELAPILRRLGGQGFDHLVVELSGVADPVSVKANLRAEGLPVARTVALVDASAFRYNWRSVDGAYQRPEILAEIFASRAQTSVDQPVVELLLRQLEAANLLLVNKADLASEVELQDTLDICRAVGRGASVVAASYGAVPLDALLPPTGQPPLADAEAGVDTGAAVAAAAAAAVAAEEAAEMVPCQPCGTGALGTGATTMAALGFGSIVYRARRPFVEARLRDLISSWELPRTFFLGDLDEDLDEAAEAATAATAATDGGGASSAFEGVLRSKGVVWVDSHHEQMVTWSSAGRHVSVEAEQAWWAMLPDASMRAVLDRGGAQGAAEYDAERQAFEGTLGDRRQER